MQKLSLVLDSELSELRAAAFEDELTGLPNRRALLREIKSACHDQRQYALLFVDLDKFKRINDGYGHAAGDELLRYAARRLRARLRAGDFLARVGGDEFVVLLRTGDVAGAAERMRRPLRYPGMPVVGVSAGVASSAESDALELAGRRVYDDK